MFREILETMVESRQDFLPQMLPLCHIWASQLIPLGLYYLIYKMKTISVASSLHSYVGYIMSYFEGIL